jgi:hypothetical protein
MANFGMHLVFRCVIRLDRQEGAGSDMQRDEMPFDTARIKPGKQIAA